ncbi:MAG TPA: IclR family transcriptional regulator C-terminal domain-containing protein [Thermodesulfobacteriota bacterium]
MLPVRAAGAVAWRANTADSGDRSGCRRDGAAGTPPALPAIDRAVVHARQARPVLDALAAETALTIRDPRALASRLPAIASRGHALDDGEYAPDVRCVAAPVRDYARRVVGAISLSGPASRLTDRRLVADLVPRLEQAAGRLSQRLGYAAE